MTERTPQPARQPASRGRHLAAQALLAGLALLAAWPAAATSYVFTTSGTSVDQSTAAIDVNRSGVVVGYSFDNTTGVSTAFRYAAGVRTAIAGPAGAVSVDLVGITDSGTMVGNYATDLVDDGFGNLVPGQTRMFTLTGGVYSDVAVPGLAAPSLQAVSPNGRWLLGYYDNGLTGLRSFAFDTQGGALTLFDGSATSVIAAGVNDRGIVVGYDRTFVPNVGNTGPGWTFDLSTGLRSDFQVAGSQRSGPRDITEAGVISGYYYTSLRPAVVQGFTGLNGSYALVDVPGASQTQVLGANDLGALVGQYIDADGNFGAFLAVPVPEPAPALLLLAGLAGLAGLRQRQLSLARRPS